MPKNKVVVDANILISILLGSRSNLAALIGLLYQLYAPEKIIYHVLKYEKLICEKRSCTKQQFNENLNSLLKIINIIKINNYEKFIHSASDALGARDASDIDYLACALAIKADFIWSRDKDFTSQMLVPVKNTGQVIKRLKIFKYLDHLISSKMRER